MDSIQKQKLVDYHEQRERQADTVAQEEIAGHLFSFAFQLDALVALLGKPTTVYNVPVRSWRQDTRRKPMLCRYVWEDKRDDEESYVYVIRADIFPDCIIVTLQLNGREQFQFPVHRNRSEGSTGSLEYITRNLAEMVHGAETMELD